MNKRKSIFFSSVMISILIILIKCLGLIKQIVLAKNVGASLESDIFFVSSGVISQLMIAIFSAIAIIVLASYTKIRIIDGIEGSSHFIFDCLKVLIPIAVIITIIIYFFSYPISKFLAPNYDETELLILNNYIKIMSLAAIPWCYFLVINVVLEEQKIFLPGKCQALFQNLFIIFASIFLYKKFGVISLIILFLLSGIVESILLTILSIRYLSFPKTIKFKYIKEIKQVFYLSIPLLIGNAVYEINDIVDKKISLSLGEGFASILSYGSTINEIVASVVVGALSTVLFANFASFVAKNEFDNLKKTIEKSILFLLYILAPITVIFILSRVEIVTILYGRGGFSEKEILDTSNVLLGYSLGFVFQAIRSIMSKVFYANNNTRIPMITGIICVGLNIGLSILLSTKLGILGVSLATSISVFVSSVILLSFSRKVVIIDIKKIVFNIVFALLIAVITYFGVGYVCKFIDINVYLNALIKVSLCLTVYFILLLSLRKDLRKVIISYYGKIKHIH